VWLTEGLQSDSADLLPIGSKVTKALSRLSADQARTIFHSYALGVSTNKDSWLYNARKDDLERNVIAFCDVFNAELDRWKRAGRPKNVLAFVTNDVKRIKWSSLLIDKFTRERYAAFDAGKVRLSLYRPFTKEFLYFDKLLIDAPTLQEQFFPTPSQEKENISIYVSDKGLRSPFSVLAVNSIADLHLCATTDGFQSFPFYTYSDEVAKRRENITDWALEQFWAHYRDKSITKWEIFYYVYALLHHALYRQRYATNLKHELPRIPYAPDFKGFAKIGKRLADLHVNYEQQHEHPLERIETPRVPLDWRVEKMKLSKDKHSLIYNDFLTLGGIPAEAFEYRLGNRSALDWIIDQYQVSTDKRSGITNDPNRADDPQYIVRLIGQVITVSLETVHLVRQLNDLALVDTDN
jgi:predicted helicase